MENMADGLTRFLRMSPERIRSSLVIWFVQLAFVIPLTVSCDPLDSEKVSSIKMDDLAAFFQAVQSPEALPQRLAQLLDQDSEIARDDPNWPIFIYLVGEIKLRQHELEESKTAFRRLAEWAESDPYRDSWGGSSLAVVALWRWLQNLEQQDTLDADEVKHAIAIAENLRRTRLNRGMVRPGLLPAFPKLEEDVARRLARLAWRGKLGGEAQRLFVDYLAIASTSKLEPMEQRLLKRLISSGVATPERLDLFRGIRLLSLVMTQEEKEVAISLLEKLWKDSTTSPVIRAEAGYHLAYENRRKKDRNIPLEILNEVLDIEADSPLAQRALYLKGTIHNRARKGRNVEAFRRDMNVLAQRFPDGPVVDNALNQLASDYLFEGELENALTFYEKLRNLKGPNDFEDSAYFMPAIGLFGRGQTKDLEAADQLLARYIEKHPDGPFRLRSLFWRGRIAERQENSEGARAFFQDVIRERPYDYYAIRAMMHLEIGNTAQGYDLPSLDSKTREDLREKFRASKVESALIGTTPYDIHVRDAVTSGLYSNLLKLERNLLERLDNIPLSRLDSNNLLAGMALLVSLRQDTLAAKDMAFSSENPTVTESLLKKGVKDLLMLAGAVGVEANDWPLAIGLTMVRSEEPRELASALQNDRQYLATAYPVILREPIENASWVIDGSLGTSRSLMYSVIRHESRFYPGAISRVGAIGLFQIMPKTFTGLDRDWNLIQNSGKKGTTEYLLAPKLNARLWARWAQERLHIRERDGIALALMAHHAGMGNLNTWNDYWRKMGIVDDLEYKIETGRFNATRNFVRAVLADLAIVDAAGFLGE